MQKVNYKINKILLSKNVATISLDTTDFFKLKKRLNVKNSSKILSRNHSNE